MNTSLLTLLIVSIFNYTPFMIQEKSMCTGIDFYNPVYDDDYFGDILNILDYPVCETLDGDTENWAKLGPIPSEDDLRVVLPPVGGGTGGGGDSADSFPDSCVINHTNSQPIYENTFKSRQKSFEAPSPDSVLEQRTASSAGKTVSFNTEISIPVRTRTKRSRSTLTENPWSKSTLPIPLQKGKKKRRNIKISRHVNDEIKKCSHCEITKTPQWREGPMGPKTLCNACGVRYRSGRLFPEYRPAASPSFVPNLHSNSHRKVIEMRQKGGGMNDDDYFRKNVLSSNLIDTT